LVVDDNETNRIILQENFVGWGAKPILVDSARKAVSVLKLAKQKNVNINLVVTDFHMPEYDGLSLVKALRRSEELRETKVIVLSSVGDDELARNFRALDVVDILTKPARLSLLKAAISRALTDRNIESLREAASSTTPTSNLHIPDRISVLVVDDNDVNLAVIQNMIDPSRIAFQTAKNGREAYNKARSTNYDLVLMDISMPIMDGVEATMAIRSHEAANGLPKTPIIALTARAMANDRQRFIAAGMDDYISKPFEHAELLPATTCWEGL